VKGTEVVSLYQPWSYNDSIYGNQQAGFLTQFNNLFSFATVHHAGHEVPAYQPQRAFELFKRYLDGSFFFNLTTITTNTNSGIEETAISPKTEPNLFLFVGVTLSVVGLIVCLGFLYQCVSKRSFNYQLSTDMDSTRHTSEGVSDTTTIDL